MFFTNKWANLAVIAAVALVIGLVLINSAKVVDKDNKPTGNKLGFAADAAATTTPTKS